MRRFLCTLLSVVCLLLFSAASRAFPASEEWRPASDEETKTKAPTPVVPAWDETPPIEYHEKPKGTEWGKVILDSLVTQGVFHGIRMTEEKTRRHLGGPFFKDWFDSIQALEWKWDDGGKFFANYVSHPWAGSIYANIFAAHNAHSQRVTFGWNRDYWNAKHKQFLFSTVSSLMFEIGPISEASLGNVGINRYGAQRVGDYVVTPVAGTYVWSVGEDALDRWALHLEKDHFYWGRVVRTLCITKAFANLMGFRTPWWRARDHQPAP